MLRPLTALVMVSLLSSCALLDNQFRGEPYGKPETEDSGQPAEPAEPVGLPRTAEELAARKKAERIPPSIYRGTDQPINMPAVEEPIRLVGEDVSLNFEEAPLGEVVHAVLGDILGLDYIVDHPVQGKITLRSRTPIPRDQLLQVLESLLRANNVIMTRTADGRFLVTGSEQGTRLAPRLSNPASERAGYSTIVVPLRYISASNMAEILGPMAEEQAFLRIDNSRNLLILAGTQAQLDGWLDMIATFDVDLLKGMSVGLFPLENSRVEEAAQVIDGMLGSGSGGGGGEGEGGEGGNNFSRLVRVIPVKRLNSLLVVTPRAHYLDTVGTWIERLDAAPDSNFEKRLHVYEVQNTTSSRLADLIQGIYSGGGGGSSTGAAARSGATDRGVAPGMSMESIGSGSSSRSSRSSGSYGSGSSRSSSSGMGSFGSSNRSSDTSGSTVTSIGGDEESEIADVRVVADEENNSLMIYATGKQYGIIEDALKQLDVVATQVIIEASILEVTLTEDLRYGLEWSFKNGLGSRYSGSGQQVNSGSAPSVTAPGFSYSITNPAGNINAVLNALSEDSLINVISSPSVMVLDNHTAFIHVGDQVAIRQGSLVTGEVVTENFQYRDTGVKLMVRPSVNAGRLVTMDVEQSVTDIGTATINEQPTFLERNIMSRVAVRSDESVVLGGLIRENASSRDSGVPLLHRIPVLGALFGNTVNNNRRTELLVIITPRVLANETELREVSEELRSRVRHMQLIDDPLLTEE